MSKYPIGFIVAGKYKITGNLGGGGNAIVYEATSISDGKKVALKILKTGGRYFEEKCQRFIVETKTVISIQENIDGIIPIYDFALPDEKYRRMFWYTMPIATPIWEIIKQNDNILHIVEVTIDLSRSLKELHDKNIVHRDIKPNNLYFYQEQYCFGDFGLVDYPDKDNLTKNGESIGAKWTIAPEMQRNAKISDGQKADVYSLAKTLWILLTKIETGFEGTYDPLSQLMGLKNFYPKQHLVELNALLTASTKDDPILRPSIEQFIILLSNWIDVQSDYGKSNLSQWKYMQESIFNSSIPEMTQWKDRNKIVNILKLIGSMPSLNHMFIPTGGGMDLDFADIATEEGCIAMYAGSIHILKPNRLIFENVSDDHLWSYFRLELLELRAEVEKDNIDMESVTEYEPGKYISWIHGNYGYYEDKPLPQSSRMVERILRGTFVFFAKSSVYNHISGTYDSRHDKFRTDEFRSYIEKMRSRWMETKGNKLFYDFYNMNPYTEEKDNSTDILTLVEAEDKFIFFLRKAIFKIDYKSICEKANKIECSDGSMNYTLDLYFNGDIFKPKYYLNSEGILVIDSNNMLRRNTEFKDKYIFDAFGKTLFTIQEIEATFKTLCEKNEIVWHEHKLLFSIKLIRNSLPKHLFTKEEIKVALINGNDHKNNTLVIDSDGYPLLIERTQGSVLMLQQYPVVHETYGAYNNYTGKYSSLNHLDDAYLLSLEGWLSHLKYGGRTRKDYMDGDKTEEELINDIRRFYEQLPE